MSGIWRGRFGWWWKTVVHRIWTCYLSCTRFSQVGLTEDCSPAILITSSQGTCFANVIDYNFIIMNHTNPATLPVMNLCKQFTTKYKYIILFTYHKYKSYSQICEAFNMVLSFILHLQYISHSYIRNKRRTKLE